MPGVDATADVGASGSRSPAYRFVEGAHLRQWLARLAAPLAVLCTNGAGLLDVTWLPRHDAPVHVLGLPTWTADAVRAGAGALVLASVVLRILSKGVLVRRTTLTTGGVYAHVRHPFYVAVVLGSAGVLALAGPLGAALAGVWLLAAAPVYAVTVSGEEEGLATLFPDAWRSYAQRVPALVPRPTPGVAGAERTRVTWANLVAEHEPPRLLRYLGGVAAVGGCAAGGTAGAALLAAAATAFLLSRLLPGIRPRRRREHRPRAG